MNARNIASISALTPIQEGILFHAVRDQSRQVYHSQFSARLDGELDTARWRAAWDRVIARHDILRTLFTWEGRDKPLQIVRERVDTPWQELDWSDTDSAQHETQLTALLERDRDLGFELERAPLLRLTTIRLGPAQHRLVLSFHHLILDGWSMRLILDEAQQIYADADALAGPAPSFTRYVEWQAARDASGDEAWWRERLADFDRSVFPDARDEVATTGVSHHIQKRSLSAAQSQQLTEVARQQRVTPSSVIAAAWALLLGRYAATNDVVFGTTVSGRPPQLDYVERMAGMFINTLPLRVRSDSAATVAEFLQTVQRAQVELRDMEPSALSVAQKASGIAPGDALFESILVFENFPAAANTPARDLTLEIDHFVEYSHFPLAILAVPTAPFELIGISDPARLSASALQDLMDNLLHTLTVMLSNPKARLASITTLTDVQHDNVVTACNATRVPAPAATTLWHQTVQHAADAPDTTALIDRNGQTSYRELMNAANHIAAALRTRDVAQGDAVMIVGPRTAATVAAIVGVHGAGAAYVPVPTAAPSQRVAQMVDELDATGRPVYAIVTGTTDVELPASVRQIDGRTLPVGDAEPAPGPALDAPAYYMFTSGSTGTPKGVTVWQRNLFHSVHARDHYYNSAPSRFALLSTLATDSSVAGLFWTLGRGGTLVLPEDRAEQDMPELIRFMDGHQVTHLLTVPSLYQMLLEASDDAQLAQLELAIVAGEACADNVVRLHESVAPQRQLHNEYGPTETTVWCTAARLDGRPSVSIGRPLANLQAYVLDPERRPVPVGVAGELYVGGPQLAAGYLGDAERTAAQFVASPFDQRQRLYRTGDRVRWSRSGELYFVGRTDDQIKVRGFRVEPGEIEAQILKHNAVNEAVVLLHGAVTASTRPLVAFVTGAPDSDALRATLAEHLPAYMVPQHIQTIDALPRTPAGKIDRRALARHPLANAVTPGTAAPRTDHERTLAAIWCEVLGLPAVGVDDDFFALGGDSLLSIRVLARAGKAGLRIAPGDFFAWPTVAGQAAHADTSGARKIAQKPVTGPQPLMPIQHWFFAHIAPGNAHWNLSYRFDLGKRFDRGDVQRAVAAVLTTHDALRSGFEQRDGQWQCRLHAPQEFDVVSELDLRQESAANIDPAVRAAADRLNGEFSLARPPLLRACLIHTPETMKQQLVLVVHHLIVDAESWRILIEDLEVALEQTSAGQRIALPEKTDALGTYARHLLEWSQQDAFAAIERNWQQRLATAPVDLQPDTPAAGTYTEGHITQYTAALSQTETRAVLDSVSQTRATLMELLLAGAGSALGEKLGTQRVRFEVEGHGREAQFEDLDVSRTVGWMTTAFPLTLETDGVWRDASAALRAAKRALRDVPQRGLSYGVIRAGHSDSPAARSVRAASRCQVLFNFLGQSDQGPSQGLLRLVDERCGQARASDAPRAYLLEINAVIQDDCLRIHMVWPHKAFAQATMTRFADTLLDTLRALAGGQGNTVVPEDFPLANLDQQGLSDLSAMLDELDDE